MYPSLTLGGAFTTSANAFLNVFTPGATAISSVTGSLQQTLLNRRALKAQLRLQNALLDQDEVAYESTVLGAIQDVEDALKAFEAEQARQKALTGAADSAKNAAEMSRTLYSSGLKDFLTVLDSERTELSTRNSLVQSDATVAENLVRLYKAMGGGWQ
jgi:outer membrane protein TolC